MWVSEKNGVLVCVVGSLLKKIKEIGNNEAEKIEVSQMPVYGGVSVMVTKTEVNITERSREIGSGMRSMYCQRVLKQLTDNMIDRGASCEDIAVFQSDFCNANDIIVPDSFFPETLDMGDFINEKTIESNSSIKASDLYKSYLCWCKDKGVIAKTKGCFYFELRSKNILSQTGTVNGKTFKNVIKNVSIIDD